MLSLPIICETPDCPNNGQEINRISDIVPQDVETLIEDWRGDPEDYCPRCGKLGTLLDPENETP